MQNKINQFISKHQLLTNAAKVIVGVSGGADSVALLHFLWNAGYACVAAHCNFQLREEESNRDEQFVREFCKKWNIPLEVIAFDTKQVATQRKISIEMAARDLRYEWFEELRIKHEAESIAVAHHRDDNVETFLLNVIRGTGIRGLSGMAPKNGNIVRPFLDVDREEIDAYLAINSLNFVDDSSNFETIYLRNKIRLELLPWMEKINPSVKDAINRTSKNLNDVEQIYLSEIETQRHQLIREKEDAIHISIPKLKGFAQTSTLLFELLQPYGFNRIVCDDIFESLDGISGKKFFSPNFVLVKDREELIIKQISKSEGEEYFISAEKTNIDSPISLKLNHVSLNDFTLTKSKDFAYFDAEKVKFPLSLRHWEEGDWFIPFGMKGKQKVSDYFSDHKFNLHQKEAIWLLCSDTNIIWIVGERSDNRFRIDENTTEVLVVKLN
ncbi:MAG: tRNA lysidine(34) synthetase TilS [Bacteroidales bacterium]|nr:tRNA lysidine(34) synthetase TilS [Bacteroidales bacterium]